MASCIFAITWNHKQKQHSIHDNSKKENNNNKTKKTAMHDGGMVAISRVNMAK